MASSKKNAAAPQPGLIKAGRLILSAIQGPIGATVLLAGALIGAWSFTWHFVGPRVLKSDRYLLREEGLEITPLPDWIHTDVRGEVFRSLTFEGPLSIMDDGLVRRVADAFALHPWVARVLRATKHHPARVKVELEYRRPVGMVEVAGGLLPVDAEGAWLRSEDFSPVEAAAYPRISSVDSMPVGSVGMRWGDARVVGGAEIAAALADAWSELQLARIVPSPRPQSGEHHSFDIYTRGGTRILWGLPPAAGLAGAVPAAEKVARLRQFVAAHGTLDGQHQIDVRSPRGLELLPAAVR